MGKVIKPVSQPSQIPLKVSGRQLILALFRGGKCFILRSLFWNPLKRVHSQTDLYLTSYVVEDPADNPLLEIWPPGNFQINHTNDAKKYFKGAACKVYLPPWSAKEILAVARDIYNAADEHDDRLLELFGMFGGIPRAVLQSFWQDIKSLESAFVLTDILTALDEVVWTRSIIKSLGNDSAHT